MSVPYLSIWTRLGLPPTSSKNDTAVRDRDGGSPDGGVEIQTVINAHFDAAAGVAAAPTAAVVFWKL